jgi:hypothetical protein
MRLLALVALAAAAIAVTACGGDAKPPPAPGSAEKPLVGQQPTPGGGTAAGRLNEAASSKAKAKAPGYDALLDSQSSHPRSRFTPCNLVTKAQAQAIVGLALRDPLEAPRGPTCIYRSRDGKRLITLAVQPLDFAKLERRIHRRQAASVAHRRAFCATLGAPVLYVELPKRRVLSVAARCDVGRQFAMAAVRRFDA